MLTVWLFNWQGWPCDFGSMSLHFQISRGRDFIKFIQNLNRSRKRRQGLAPPISMVSYLVLLAETVIPIIFHLSIAMLIGKEGITIRAPTNHRNQFTRAMIRGNLKHGNEGEERKLIIIISKFMLHHQDPWLMVLGYLIQIHWGFLGLDHLKIDALVVRSLLGYVRPVSLQDKVSHEVLTDHRVMWNESSWFENEGNWLTCWKVLQPLYLFCWFYIFCFLPMGTNAFRFLYPAAERRKYSPDGG